MPAHPVPISALPAPVQPERFVDPDTAAAFVGITRRALLQKVRAGKIPGHALDRDAKKVSITFTRRKPKNIGSAFDRIACLADVVVNGSADSGL